MLTQCLVTFKNISFTQRSLLTQTTTATTTGDVLKNKGIRVNKQEIVWLVISMLGLRTGKVVSRRLINRRFSKDRTVCYAKSDLIHYTFLFKILLSFFFTQFGSNRRL